MSIHLVAATCKLSIDYWFFKKEYIGKQIDYKTPHISVEGYLIDNNSYWCEEYGLPPLPIRVVMILTIKLLKCMKKI